MSPHQFGDYTIHYDTEDYGERRPRHVIEAVHPGSEEPVGRMTYNAREITRFDIEPGHQRKGLGTAMWGHGQRQKVRPKHSADRTTAGDAWARKVGGRLPRRK